MPSTRRPRPHQTARERIIEAAAVELSRSGFAGTRMDAIARRAKCNKQLIYYYFSGKAELADTVLERMALEAVPVWTELEDASLADIARVSVSRSVGYTTSRRLLAWEGFEYDSSSSRRIAVSETRSAAWEKMVSLISSLQAEGEVTERLEPRLIALLIVLTGMAPFMLPQVTRMITGLEADDPAFVEAWQSTLEGLAAQLRPR